jgi:methyl-accepting chemotaxis protein
MATGEAIGTIGQTIRDLSGISAAVAGATEEQNTAAQSISSNMQRAAGAVDSISRAVTQIATASRADDESTRKVKEASQSLAA